MEVLLIYIYIAYHYILLLKTNLCHAYLTVKVSSLEKFCGTILLTFHINGHLALS